MRLLVFVAVLAVVCYAFFAVGQATAWTKEPRLSLAASIFAMRSVSVRCFTPDEKGAPAEYGAYGYVRKPLGKARYAALDSGLCASALSVNDPALPRVDRALGVLVLIHEAYHLRRWGAAGDEGQVECQAIRHWKIGARMLGASEGVIADLWPTALSLHYEETRIVAPTGERPYDYAPCRVPSVIKEAP